MKLITDLRKRVIEFNKGVTSGEYISEILLDQEAFIVEMNSEEQLYEQGITSLGVSIADYAPYSEITIEIKQMQGQPTDRVTLRDEGDFHGSFYLRVNNQEFEIMAGDWKTRDLMRGYGDEILGLTNENIASVIWDYLYFFIMKRAKELLYGKK